MTNHDPGRRVLVYGATGHTARAVAAALVERGLVPVLAARDARRLDDLAGRLGLEALAFAADDVPDLAGHEAVVNCAGPFADTALPLARAALAAGAHYLDIAAEQPSTLALLHAWGAPAERAGVVVMPGVGFFGALGDLLLTALVGRDDAPWDRAEIEVELSGWHPSDGTLATGDRDPGARLRLSEGLLVTTEDDDLPPGREELRLSEPVLVLRHLPVRTLRTTVNAAAVDDLEAGRLQTPEARASARESRGDSFRMRVTASRGDERRSGTVEGDDFYAITGPLVAEVAAAVLAGGVAPGARAPGELADAAGLLRRLPLSACLLPDAGRGAAPA